MAGLRLKLKNFRAIADADIELADLTVLSGVNASGKSTVARLFHNIVELNRNYTLWCEKTAFVETLSPYVQQIVEVFQDLKFSVVELEDAIHALSTINLTSFSERVTNVYECIRKLLKHASRKKDIDKRLWESFQRSISSNTSIDSVEMFGEWVKERFNSFETLFKEYEQRKDSTHPFVYMLLAKNLFDLEEEDSILDRICLYDGEEKLFNLSANATILPYIYSPKRSLYIEKPSVTVPKMIRERLVLASDVYDLTKKGIGSELSMPRDVLSKNNYLNGFLDVPTDNTFVFEDEWIYKRSDGRNFQLKKCAEGIKSLATVQILERYGLLDSNTLLIIDEPEVHLHPQWIVECANTLIDLVKEKRVRVLVTSHSPYLVQALQQKAYKKLEQGQCCFYLAEKEGNFTYSYHRLGMNIAPIFRTFNVALDQIAEISE